MHIRFRKIIDWFCACTFLFSVTAPTIAHSYTSIDASNPLKMEICIADGSKRVIDVDSDTSGSIQDCPHCVAQSLPPLGLLGSLAFALPRSQAPYFNPYPVFRQTSFSLIKLPSHGPPHQFSI
jgi:hypothetical protein